MLIQCLRIRPNGTTVSLGGAEYHFAPRADLEGAPHLCEVANTDHISRLLQIDAYRIFAPGKAEPAATAQAAPAAPVEGGADLEALSLEGLQALYAETFGRKPHHKAGKDKLIEALSAPADI